LSDPHVRVSEVFQAMDLQSYPGAFLPKPSTDGKQLPGQILPFHLVDLSAKCFPNGWNFGTWSGHTWV